MLNALEALKLAKETGCKIRPKDTYTAWYYVWTKSNGWSCLNENGIELNDGGEISPSEIINEDGSPVEWEILTALTGEQNNVR